MKNILRHWAMVVSALVALGLVTPQPAQANGENLARERAQFSAAETLARSEPGERWRLAAEGLEDYPLYAYIEFAAINRMAGQASLAEVRAFIAREPDSLLAQRLRTDWLKRLASAQRWSEFVDLWNPRTDLELRCAYFTARTTTGEGGDDADAELKNFALELWMSAQNLPSRCNGIERWLTQRQLLSADRLWERIALAAEAGNGGLIKALAAWLPEADRAAALTGSALIANPGPALASLDGVRDSPRLRPLLAKAVARLARNDAALAGTRWRAIESRFEFSPSERGEAIGAIAFQYALRYEPAADDWYAQLPPDTGSDAAREWRLRAAIARQQFAQARTAFTELTQAQRREPRMRWLDARAAEQLGDDAAARAGFAELAVEPNFFGFLAADQIGAAYTLCPLTPSEDPALKAEVLATPGLRRAFELKAIERDIDARREWDHSVAALTLDARALAVAAALTKGWSDRGPLTLLRPDETRLYTLRFPLAYREPIKTAAKRNDLDPAWVFGLIRSESAFNSAARSHADARGLMQLLPSTARDVAAREGVALKNVADLMQPPLNIRLGTRYLAERQRLYNGRLWLATAAYNAGPAPVRRWLDARPELPADLWAETVTYRETREYIARVMAFSVIYDWQLNARPQRVSVRMGLAPADTARTEVICAQPIASLNHSPSTTDNGAP